MTDWLPGSARPLASEFDALLVDLDGVVYIGPNPVPHAAESLAIAREQGVLLAYVTNNASRTPADVAEHLRQFGLEVSAHDVVTSSQAGARLVAEHVAPGAAVLAIGGPGVAAALRERGFRVVFTAAESPAAVMQGFGPDVGWRDLAEGTFAVNAGAVFVATNPDLTFPAPGGRAPGNGSLVAVIASVTGVTPLVAGKPESPLMIESIDRLGAQHPLVVGDRLDTDIEAAARLALPSLLVLTGVTDVTELLAAPAHARPTFLGDDLRALFFAHPPVVLNERGARCADAEVDVVDGVVRAVGQPGSWLNLMRAAAVSCWQTADRGGVVDIGATVTTLTAQFAATPSP